MLRCRFIETYSSGVIAALLPQAMRNFQSSAVNIGLNLNLRVDRSGECDRDPAGDAHVENFVPRAISDYDVGCCFRFDPHTLGDFHLAPAPAAAVTDAISTECAEI